VQSQIRSGGVSMRNRYFATLSPSRWLAAFGLFLTVSACAHRGLAPRRKEVCLVLSAGGADGVAHIGAIQAVQKAVQQTGLKVSCVVGTSMGALMGGLYAHDPSADPADSYRALINAYETATRLEAAKRAVTGAAIGGALGGIVGGLIGGETDPDSGARMTPAEEAAVLGAGLGAGLGAAAGAGTTDKLQLKRLIGVLNRYFEEAQIQEIPLPYVTFHQARSGDGLRVIRSQSGNLAEAIGRSIANPFIFKSFDAARAGFVDPGSDRLLATPLDEACRLFPNAQHLVVNVTGEPALLSASADRQGCQYEEVMIDPSFPTKAADSTSRSSPSANQSPTAALAAEEPLYSTLIERGRQATAAALAR